MGIKFKSLGPVRQWEILKMNMGNMDSRTGRAFEKKNVSLIPKSCKFQMKKSEHSWNGIHVVRKHLNKAVVSSLYTVKYYNWS